MATYDFTITSVMSIDKPTMNGYDPNIHFVTFRNLDCIEYKGSSREFHDYIFTCAGRHYDNANGGYYSLGMAIPPEILRDFEDAIDPQMLKCQLHVTNARERLGHQWVPTIQFKFTVKEVVSVYKKEEKDMRSEYCAADAKVTEALFYRFNPHHFIKKVIYNDPATIIFWSNGTKTVVKRMEDEEYDPEKGFMAAVTKKVFGDKYGWVLRHHVKPAVEHEDKVSALMDSIAETLHRKRTAKESAICIRDQMMLSGATQWELETFDRFVRKYIADKEDK